MAPSLISPIDEGHKLSTKQSNYPTNSKPIVPVIPRALEKRTKAASTRAASTSRGLGENAVEGINDGLAPLESGALDYGDACVPAEVSGNDGARVEDSIQETAQADHCKDNNIAPPPLFEHPYDFSESGFQEPPVSYSQVNGYHSTGMPTQLPHRNPLHSRFVDQNIVFGVEVESSQSSPGFSPSAPSATFTQSTPSSDTTAPLPQNTYQGYGHTYYAQPHLPLKTASLSSVKNQPVPVYIPPETYVSSNVPLPNVQELTSSPNNAVVGQFVSDITIGPSEALQAHLSNQFNNPTYSDCRLDVHVINQQHSLMLHRILIAQNHVLRNLLVSSTQKDGDKRTIMSLDLSNAYATLAAIAALISTYYGKSLSHMLLFFPESVAPISQQQLPPRYLWQANSVEHMKDLLAYLAAGVALQMPEVVSYILQIAAPKISFTTLETVLTYWFHPPHFQGSRSSETVPALDGGDEITTSKLLNHCLDFIVSNLPNPFVLDKQAPSSLALGGFPERKPQDSKRSFSNPRLSSIHFGDFPLDVYSPPSPEVTTISTILVSVPSHFLQNILARLSSCLREQIIPPVVEERERRRIAFVQRGTDAVLDQTMNTYLQEKSKWEEQAIDEGRHVETYKVRSTTDTTSNDHIEA